MKLQQREPTGTRLLRAARCSHGGAGGLIFASRLRSEPEIIVI
ncbi:hypothetical protein ACVJMZ_005451 [Sinorhizobium medicae]